MRWSWGCRDGGLACAGNGYGKGLGVPGRRRGARRVHDRASAQHPGQCLIRLLPRELPPGLHLGPGARPTGIVRSRVWAWLRNC